MGSLTKYARAFVTEKVVLHYHTLAQSVGVQRWPQTLVLATFYDVRAFVTIKNLLLRLSQKSQRQVFINFSVFDPR